MATIRRPARTPHLLALVAALAALDAPVAQATTLALSAGHGERTNIFAIAGVWDGASPLIERKTWRVTPHIELELKDFEGLRSGQTGYQRVAALGVTPVARIEWPGEAYRPFAEFGVGINLLSHTKLLQDPDFSTAFQFGEFLGAGLRFGARGAWEVGARVQHMSNGDIKLPNDGLNFGTLRLAYHF
ncbi:MAG TPA: acyloxyacyl hydrolase [Burkholderiales bacterium]|nr:acyloxyacyl hydrolase [Burkholderiales bacterium]